MTNPLGPLWDRLGRPKGASTAQGVVVSPERVPLAHARREHRLERREWAWWRQPTCILDIVAIALILGMALLLFRIPVGSGDYGQWLMLSRSYMGDEIPSYRQVSAVPPLMPLMLAGLRVIVHDPVPALQAFKGLLALGLGLSLYAAGGSIFRSRAAGLLSVVFGLLVTDRLLELFAFGGLPQLTSLVFMNLAIAAFAQGGSCSRLRVHWWASGSAALSLAVLAHAGTGMVAVVVGASAAFVCVLRPEEMTPRERALALAPLVAALVGLAVYWTMVIMPGNTEYTQNPALAQYRGPVHIWLRLVSYTPNLVLVAAALVVAVIGCVADASKRRVGVWCVASAWAVSAWAIVALSILAGVSTDYPRYLPPVIVPMAVLAGGGLALMASWLAEVFRGEHPAVTSVGIPVALVLVLGLAVGLRTVRQHERETGFYAAPYLSDLASVAAWLDSRLPQGQAVLASSAREGKWIEGLTGRDALFSMPVRFSFRPVERERTAAAETLLKSKTTLANEYFFIKHLESRPSPAGPIPQQPWIGVNHGGEYVDLVRVLPWESRVLDAGGNTLATLGALDGVSVAAVHSASEVELRTVWEGQRQGGAVSYARAITLRRESASFELVDEVSSATPVGGIQVRIRPMAGLTPSETRTGDNWAEIVFPAVGATQPRLRIEGVGQLVKFDSVDGGVVARVEGANRLHLAFTAASAGGPIYRLDYLTPGGVAEGFGIGAAVLEDGPARASRMDRLAALGFTLETESGPYTVMVQHSAAPPEEPTGPFDSSGPEDAGAAPLVAVPVPAPTTLPRVADSVALARVAGTLAGRLTAGASVLASTPEDGEWLALSLEKEAVFRARSLAMSAREERARSAAAETLLRSVASLSSADFLVKYVEARPGTSGDPASQPAPGLTWGTGQAVPVQPWIGVNHGGEPVDVLRLMPWDSRALAADGTIAATLNGLEAVRADAVRAEDRVELRSRWAGAREAGTITYARTVSLSKGASSLDVIDEVTSAAPLGGVQVLLRPVDGVTMKSVEAGKDYADLTFSKQGAGAPRVRVQGVGQSISFETTKEGVLATARAASRLHLRFTALTAGAPMFGLDLLMPAQVIEDYRVEAAVLQQDPSIATRVARLKALGFEEELREGPYVLLLRTPTGSEGTP